MRKIVFKNNSGQALISLLFIVLIGFTIVYSAAALIYNSVLSSSIGEQSTYAYYVAESGAEEGVLRLLRNPSYTGTQVGQPLAVDGGTVIIGVNNGLITSTGTYNNAVRKIQVQTVYNNGVLTVSSWKEIW